MNLEILLVACVAGLLAHLVRLPPLIGFLAAGFVLNGMGHELTSTLETLANMGVTLLLFTIGLKLRIGTLLRPEVWGAASIHMGLSTLVFAVLLMPLSLLGLSMLENMSFSSLALIAFALAFSSTVFAIKVLEDRGEANSLYGRVAVGILIMQDVFAVIFLAASEGKLPSPYAVILLGLIPLAPLLQKLLAKSGHGDLQTLLGITLALGLGYGLFSALGIKGDLGALIIGMLLAPHSSAGTLARSLFNIKELLLVGFFLSVGLQADLTLDAVLMGLLVLALLPVKSALYQIILMRFRLRTRTATLSTLALSNYSEFGLIVVAVAATKGWLPADWLVVVAVVVALSFVLASPLNVLSENVYRWLCPHLQTYEAQELLPQDRPIDLGDAEVVVMGMGKIGRGAYKRFQDKHGLRVLGVEKDAEKVRRLRDEGYNLCEGDAVDSDFWDKVLIANSCQMLILAMPHHANNLHAIEQLRHRAFRGRISAMVEYPEEISRLRKEGADAVFHVYEEAGQAMADDMIELARTGRTTEAHAG